MSNFTYQHEDQINQELKCKICYSPMIVPHSCQECNESFCKDCIAKCMEVKSECPLCRKSNTFSPVINSVINNQLNSLLVQCSLCQQTNINRTNFTNHINSVCPATTVSCTNGCNWQERRASLQNHLGSCRGKRRSSRFRRIFKFFPCTSSRGSISWFYPTILPINLEISSSSYHILKYHRQNNTTYCFFYIESSLKIL